MPSCNPKTHLTYDRVPVPKSPHIPRKRNDWCNPLPYRERDRYPVAIPNRTAYISDHSCRSEEDREHAQAAQTAARCIRCNNRPMNRSQVPPYVRPDPTHIRTTCKTALPCRLPAVRERDLQAKAPRCKPDNAVRTYKWQVRPEYAREAARSPNDTQHIPVLLHR